MRKSMIAYSVLAGSLLLVGCGGGGGEEDEASNDRTSRITYISLNNADIREGSENGELEVQVSLPSELGARSRSITRLGTEQQSRARITKAKAAHSRFQRVTAGDLSPYQSLVMRFTNRMRPSKWCSAIRVTPVSTVLTPSVP